MPGKVNPTQCEAITMVAAQVILLIYNMMILMIMLMIRSWVIM